MEREEFIKNPKLEYLTEMLKKYPNDKEIIYIGVYRFRFFDALKYASKELKNDKEFVLRLVYATQYDELLQYAGEELKNDKDFILRAGQKFGNALQYASEELQNDKEFVLETINKAGKIGEYDKYDIKLKNDRDVIKALVLRNPDCFRFCGKELSKELENDKDFLKDLILNCNYPPMREFWVGTNTGPMYYSNGILYAFKNRYRENEDLCSELDDYCAQRRLNDLEKGEITAENMKEILKEKPEIIIKYGSEKLRDNVDVFAYAVINNGMMLQYGSDNVKDSKTVVLNAVENNGLALQYASERLKNDSLVAVVALKNNINAKDFVGEKLKQKNVPDVVRAMMTEEEKDEYAKILDEVEKYGYLLRGLDERLKDNFEVVQKAIKNYPASIQYASERLKNNKELVNEAFSNNSLVDEGKCSLCHVGEKLRDDDDLVDRAVYYDGKNIEYASERLRGDKKIALVAMGTEDYGSDILPRGYFFEYLSDDLRADKEVALLAIKSYGGAIQYASEELKKDKELIELAINEDERNMQYVDLGVIKSDKKLLARLTRSDATNISYCLEDSKDLDLIFECAKVNKEILDYVDKKEFYHNRDMAIKLVEEVDPNCIRYFDEEIRNDEEIARIAGQKDINTLAYFGDKFGESEFLESFGLNEEQMQDYWNDVEQVVKTHPYGFLPVEVKTYAKFADIDENGRAWLNPTNYEEDVIFPVVFRNDIEQRLVYSKDLSIEENLELIHQYCWANYDVWEQLDFLEYHEKDLIDCIGERNYAKELVIIDNQIDKDFPQEELEKMVDKRVLRNRIVNDLKIDFYSKSYDSKGNKVSNYNELEQEFEEKKSSIIKEFDNEIYEVLADKYSDGWEKKKTQEEMIDEITELWEEKADLERQQAIKEGRINVKG